MITKIIACLFLLQTLYASVEQQSAPKANQPSIMDVEPNFHDGKTFTTDWSGGGRHEALKPHVCHLSGMPNIHGFEIGTYEGRSTIYWLRKLFNGKGSTLTAVDPLCYGDYKERFYQNTQEERASGKLIFHEGFSRDVLAQMLAEGQTGKFNNYFTFIYIDGSHIAQPVMTDAVMCFPLLNYGGFMLFDDYRWGKGKKQTQRPQIAIDNFLEVFSEEVEVLYKGAQVLIKKVPNKHKEEIKRKAAEAEAQKLALQQKKHSFMLKLTKLTGTDDATKKRRAHCEMRLKQIDAELQNLTK